MSAGQVVKVIKQGDSDFGRTGSVIAAEDNWVIVIIDQGQRRVFYLDQVAILVSSG